MYFSLLQDVQNFYKATERQLFQLVEWAKHIPHFTSLPIKDQVLLLRAGAFSMSCRIDFDGNEQK